MHMLAVKTKHNELLNKLILATSKEIDYWLLTKNEQLRKSEYGDRAYQMVVKRMLALRRELLTIVLAVPLLDDED